MEREIRKDILGIIVKDLNVTLSRLGISEPLGVAQQKEKNCGSLYYVSETAPTIRQMPMLFKTLCLTAHIYAMDSMKEDADYFKVFVNLDYHWTGFGGGSNGTSLGNVLYQVKKDLPKEGNEELESYNDYYVKKIESLRI